MTNPNRSNVKSKNVMGALKRGVPVAVLAAGLALFGCADKEPAEPVAVEEPADETSEEVQPAESQEQEGVPGIDYKVPEEEAPEDITDELLPPGALPPESFIEDIKNIMDCKKVVYLGLDTYVGDLYVYELTYDDGRIEWFTTPIDRFAGANRSYNPLD
jgi:hypothetical protein